MDEGHMGFIDALAAGVKTIVTRQGYHLDAVNGITHPFKTYDELEEIFLKIQNERMQLVNAVHDWNWNDYTRKHVEVWKFLLGNFEHESYFNDGLNSLIRARNDAFEFDEKFIKQKKIQLKKGQYAHLYYKNKRQFSTVYRQDGLNGVIGLLTKKLKNKLHL